MLEGVPGCSEPLRHGNALFKFETFEKADLTVRRITQGKGVLIVTFPSGHHSCFSHGFKIAEAVNFTMPRWIGIGVVYRQVRSQSLRYDGQ